MAKDYYKTLGIDKSASQDDVKRAFRKLEKAKKKGGVRGEGGGRRRGSGRYL